MTAAGIGSRRVRLLVTVGALLALAAAVHLAVGRGGARAPEPAPIAPAADAGRIRLGRAAQENAGIVIEAAQRLTRADQLQAPGELALDQTQTARIGSMVDGRVLRVLVEVGDRVESGKVLAEIQSPIVHDTWAAYRKAVAERKRAAAELSYAGQAHERAQRLFADKAVSAQEVQRTQVDRQLAEQGLEMAQTEVRRSEEVLEHLGITSGEDPSSETGERIPVRSPISGAVLERSVTEGTTVNAGTPMFVVSDLSALWALAEIEEVRLPSVAVGLAVTVRVAAYPEERFPGAVILVSDTLDPTTRRVQVRCRVANPTGRLKPRMYATIALSAGLPRSIVAVPAAAVHDVGGKTMVFVADTTDAFTPRDVTAGTEADGWVEIVAGLEAGERVAATGSFLLKSELLKPSGSGD